MHQTGEALVPVLIGVIIDEAVATGDAGALARLVAVLIGLFVVLSLSFRFSLRLGERGSERASHAIRMELTARVLHSGGGAENGRLSGELASIATGDAKRVGSVNLALPIAFAAVVGLVVGAVALLRVSVPLGLLILVVAPLMLVLAHLLGKPLERRSEAEQDRAAQASGIAADLVSGLRALKGIGAESTAASRYHLTSQGSLVAAVRAARAQSLLEGSVLTLTGLFLALIALVGGKLAVQGDITVGQLVAAVGLAQFLLWPLTIFSWVNGLFAQGRASAKRVTEVLSAPYAVPPAAGSLPSDVRGHLRLSGVSSDSLRSLDLEVRPGELLGVVAPDPADAAALLRLLGREVDPTAGSVELDGVCVSTVDVSSLRGSVVVAAHDADLFEGTVASNVVGDVDGALDASALTLPLETPVSERGRSLSGGQRQRVALARALALAPPVLVLHDPSTAVDAVTEVSLAAGIREMRRDRTTIVVASSPALLGAADRVVLLSDGRFVASGTHSDLVRDHETYRAAVLS
ncbi:ABC transporter ATP-binding protein [Lentzea tibetensis]|uniref:ABC transporter ATP-binding protein n=2 Tax=Lentzea tibetensis TaxID=2591470 RepID=A0A563EJX2_9PSEU|nr:ABC transporter ATP-binding protein [Lentzea tibetensis]TWP47340.1 ABC transporter ATP-binding protein [Lentzea tibetensis]